MEPDLLQVLSILSVIKNVTLVADCDATKILSWLEVQLSASPKYLAERVRSAVSGSKYNPSNDDRARAASFLVLYVIKIIDLNNASEVVKDN